MGAFDLVIGNLATRAFITAQYVPQKVTEELSSNLEKLKVLGMSHEPLQYASTSNHKLSLALEFNGDPKKGTTAAEQRRFLLANHYPSRSSRNVKSGGPSGIVVDWPNLFSLVCVQMKIAIEHELFLPDGTPRRFTAKVDFEELRDFRLYAEDVARFGTVRR